LNILEKNAQKYFGLTILLSASLGLFLPSLGMKLNFLVIPSLFVLMFYTALKINFNKLQQSVFKIKYLVIGTLISFIIIPLILYIIAHLFNFNDMQKMSVVLSALAPTILSAPYFVAVMKGDVEFAFILSVLLTFLSPFIIPLELYFLFQSNIDISVVEIFKSILYLIFIPVLIAYIIKKIRLNIGEVLLSKEHTAISVVFFVFIWAIISVNADSILSLSSYILEVLLISIIQEFGFFFVILKISRKFLSNSMSKSFAFSIAVKNTALTAGIAIVYSNDLSLVSSMVVLMHVPMFAYIFWKKDKI